MPIKLHKYFLFKHEKTLHHKNKDFTKEDIVFFRN